MSNEALTDIALSSDPATRAENSLTRTLWESSAATYDAILELPFLTELASGELSEERFTYYLVQDGYYMRAYNRSLATIAAKAPDIEISNLIFSHIVGAIGLEAGLHAELMQIMGTEPMMEQWPDASPTGLAYSNSISTACERGSFLEGLVSVLPCYWIYARVGAQLQQSSSSHAAYSKWIESYGDGVFEKSVVEVLDVVDALGTHAGEGEWDACLKQYRSGSRYEWMFWDAAHRLEQWPTIAQQH